MKRPTARARFAARNTAGKRLQATIALERKQRLASYARELRQYTRAQRMAGTAGAPILRLLAEGDSWFDYPLGSDLIDQLRKLFGVPIANLAHHGDEVRGMLALKQRQEIARRLQAGAPDGRPWDMLLFSGGGNDFVGDPLCLWLKPGGAIAQPRDAIDLSRYAAVMSIIEGGYRDLIALRDALSPATLLVFHTYDYALPNGKGVCGLGPWLRPSLDYRGIDRAVQPAVVREMLLLFRHTVLAAAQGRDDVLVVDTQGAIPEQTGEWWANELHPTRKGFARIAQRIAAAIRARTPAAYFAAVSSDSMA